MMDYKNIQDKQNQNRYIFLNETMSKISSIFDSNLSENQSLNYILKRNEALDIKFFYVFLKKKIKSPFERRRYK